jgi:crotonobetainyl-CoA:carnitine CoA-transferase CaiB-like acyl-CoA transferase
VSTPAEQDHDSQKPLSGKRVVEFGLYHAGPTCAAMLAALGADVIKVEDVNKGDPARGLLRLYGQDCRLADNRSIPFETYNGGKKSVALNLSHPEGIALLYRLIAKADIFVHNIRDHAARSMHIDYDSLLVHNPRLVYAGISGFGPHGPEAGRPGLDPVGLARSGMMAVLSGGSDKSPILPPAGLADHMAGILAAFGVLAALIARDQTNAPQRVESSLLGGAMWLGQLNLQYTLFSGRELLPLDRSSDPLLNSYRCGDGHWIFIAAPSERAWPALCTALGVERLASDPRFNNFEARWANRAELRILLEERFASRSSVQWTRDLAVQPALVFEVVRSPTQVGTDPQILANSYAVETEHPDIGRTKRIGLPLHINGSPCGVGTPAPLHGQHTEEVLMSVTDLTWEEVDGLRSRGAI